MTKYLAGQTEAPRQIAGLTFVFTFIAMYGLGLSLPIIAVGLFVGPKTLWSGLLHAILGGVTLLIRFGIIRRLRCAWWCAVGFASFAIGALLVLSASLLFGGWLDTAEERFGASIVPIAGLALMAVTLLNLLRLEVRSVLCR